MLIADKHRLENQTKVKLLAIRETELELYVQNCRQVGFVAAIVGGLAYFSFLYTKRDYYRRPTGSPACCIERQVTSAPSERAWRLRARKAKRGTSA